MTRRTNGRVRAIGSRARHWLTTTDHADVGRLYLAFGAVAGLWGAADAMALRTELLTPGQAVWSATTYDAFFTTHGLTMLFFFATPVVFGLANVVVPPLVGADDLAFPGSTQPRSGCCRPRYSSRAPASSATCSASRIWRRPPSGGRCTSRWPALPPAPVSTCS
ncbi:cbb3-type cytochrome c oxidase subunit I [Halosimplex aquaticum]